MDSGAQCVMIFGIQETQMWLVDNLDFLVDLPVEPATEQAVMQSEISSIEYSVIALIELWHSNILVFDK